MAAAKLHTHRVTINDKRRSRKKQRDTLERGIPKDALSHVFESYYRDQVRALWRAVLDEK